MGPVSDDALRPLRPPASSGLMSTISPARPGDSQLWAVRAVMSEWPTWTSEVKVMDRMGTWWGASGWAWGRALMPHCPHRGSTDMGDPAGRPHLPSDRVQPLSPRG